MVTVFINGEFLIIEKDDEARAYIIHWPDGSQEKIPFGERILAE